MKSDCHGTTANAINYYFRYYHYFAVFAAAVAVKLTKVTKYNLSWILISFGFVIMAVQRLLEFLPFVTEFKPQYFRLFITGWVQLPVFSLL